MITKVVPISVIAIGVVLLAALYVFCRHGGRTFNEKSADVMMPKKYSYFNVSHLAAITDQGEEIGKAPIGLHNIKRTGTVQFTRSDGATSTDFENSEPIRIPIMASGTVVGTAFIDSNGARLGVSLFKDGPREFKVGDWLTFGAGKFVGVPAEKETENRIVFS